MDKIIFISKEEAELVLNRLKDIINLNGFAYVGDLHDLVGLPKTYMDDRYGWMILNKIEIQQVEDGYFIDLPQPGSIIHISLIDDLASMLIKVVDTFQFEHPEVRRVLKRYQDFKGLPSGHWTNKG